MTSTYPTPYAQIPVQTLKVYDKNKEKNGKKISVISAVLKKIGNSVRFSSKINAYSFFPLFRSLDLRVFVCLAMILTVDDEAVKECPLRDYTKEECKNLVGVFNRMKVRRGFHFFIIPLFGERMPVINK